MQRRRRNCFGNSTIFPCVWHDDGSNSHCYASNKMVLLPKFDVDTALKTIDKQKPTIFPGAPTIYIGLLNHPDIYKV